MKKNYIVIGALLLLILVIMGFANINEQKFYYAYNEKVYLNELDNKVIVRYKLNKKSDKSKISLSSELSNKQIEWKDDSTCIITMDASEKGTLKDRILQQIDVKSCNPVFSINTGLEMGVTDEFLVKFNNNVSLTEIEKLHRKYGVVVVKTTELYQLIKVPDGQDALGIANKYQESGLTRFSHPNFISKEELHQLIPNDPYFVNQFALNNTGQVFTDGHWGANDADIDAPEAWTITQGNNNILIAVLDEGLTPDHPDLPNARQVRLNGSNFADGDPNNPSPTANNNHGNACAGIIGATQNNNQGISGIAPNCRIMPIRKYNTDGSAITPQGNADAINFARNNGADIISCSWGYNSDNPNLYPVIKDAIIAATTLGRNGLGCIVVFSAGNTANRVAGNNGYVSFPANVDVPGVLTVGASDRDDWQANYSPTSDPNSSNNQMVDLVAPSHRAYSCQIAGETSEAWSIDIPGDPGYNPVHANDCGVLPGIGTILPNAGVNNLSYTARFGGTSYSCPQVAAIAALMLSVNPNLTQQQVYDILTTTADRVGGYVYTNGRSNELGFGRLNACSAVRQALSLALTITGANTICSSGETFIINNLPPGFSPVWDKSSNLNLTIIPNSNQAFVTPNTSGMSWISAIISTNCGDITILKNGLVAGLPSNATIQASYTSGGSTYWMQESNCLLDYTFPGMYSGSIDIFDPCTNMVTWTKVSQSPGTSFVIFFNNNFGKHAEITIKPLGSSAVYKMTAANQCGLYTHNYTFRASTPQTCGGIIEMAAVSISISPNPATDNVTVSLAETQAQTSGLEADKTEKSPKEPKSYTLRVYNNYGIPVYTVRMQGLSSTFSTSNLLNGLYIIDVSDGVNSYKNR